MPRTVPTILVIDDEEMIVNFVGLVLKQAGFRVLVTAYMPAVLVEIGFGTNPREAAYMTDPSKQDALARAIADAAMEYLQRYEGRLAGGGPSR